MRKRSVEDHAGRMCLLHSLRRPSQQQPSASFLLASKRPYNKKEHRATCAHKKLMNTQITKGHVAGFHWCFPQPIFSRAFTVENTSSQTIRTHKTPLIREPQIHVPFLKKLGNDFKWLRVQTLWGPVISPSVLGLLAGKCRD